MTVKRITLTWRNGRYFVSEPNIDTCEIVLASDYTALEKVLRECVGALARIYDFGLDDSQPTTETLAVYDRIKAALAAADAVLEVKDGN